VGFIKKQLVKIAKRFIAESIAEEDLEGVFLKFLIRKSKDSQDLQWAKRYVIKSSLAEKSGHDFDLNFTSFKNIMRAKYCAYSGVELTTRFNSRQMKFTDRTIERVDNKLGYVKGNVVAICFGVNQLKSKMENPKCPYSKGDFNNDLRNIKRQPWRYIKNHKKPQKN
jgi:hypothetical protein